jgi:LacI family transcriptional regulator
MTRVSMQTIAQHLGVSKYAVSRSLAGKGGVSEATRRNVAQAARELGYVAPSLVMSARTIQLVLHDHDPVNSEVQLRIQRGIQREAERYGYPVQMQWTHDLRRIHELGRSGAGMILVGPHAPVGTQFALRRVPLVKVGLIAPLEPVDQVDTGANEATAALGLKLLEHGHRDIVFLQGNGQLRGRTGRFRALRDALADAGTAQATELFFDENGGFLAAFEALRASGRRPTALVAGNDWIAVSVISDLLRAGVRVPHDISVVGYGDYAAAVQTTPQLTTIRVPGEEMGAAALQLLLERIERRADPSRAPRRIVIAPTLVERQSLARR